MSRTFRSRLSPALAVSALAIVLTLSNGIALASGLIGTSQIKNGAVTARKLHARAVTPSKLAPLPPYQLVGTTAVPFLNGWTNDNTLQNVPARFYKDPYGVVHLEGVIKGGSSSPVFVLPKGFRPRFRHIWPIVAPGGAGVCIVYPGGQVLVFPLSSGSLSLDGVSFRLS